MVKSTPSIDFSSYIKTSNGTEDLSSEIGTKLSQSGFLIIENLGINQKYLENLFKASKAFFDMNEEEKNQFAYSSAESNFGYQAINSERLNSGSHPDLKETLTLRNPGQYPVENFPSAEFRQALLLFYLDVLEASRKIFFCIENYLGITKGFFNSLHTGENITIRLLHYPNNSEPLNNQFGAGAHTDYGAITLLFSEGIGGLEIFIDNEWIQLNSNIDEVIINTGDLMEIWTDGHFPSALHRVTTSPGRSRRFSIAVFLDPDSDVVVESFNHSRCDDENSNYETVLVSEFLSRRISDSHK